MEAEGSLASPAVDGVRRAILDAGPAPGYHWEQIARLVAEWPTLASALAALLAEHGDPIPEPWRSRDA